MRKKSLLTTGKLAKAAGIGTQTVHFYERQGLLSPALRTEAGHRLFDPDALKVLRIVKNAQTLGFTLKQIRTILNARKRGKAACKPVRRRAQHRLRAVRDEISELKSREHRLERLIAKCSSDRKHRGACDIITALEREPKP